MPKNINKINYIRKKIDHLIFILCYNSSLPKVLPHLEDKFAQYELPEEQCSVHNDQTKLEDKHHQEGDGHPVVFQICPHTSIPLLGLQHLSNDLTLLNFINHLWSMELQYTMLRLYYQSDKVLSHLPQMLRSQK